MDFEMKLVELPKTPNKNECPWCDEAIHEEDFQVLNKLKSCPHCNMPIEIDQNKAMGYNQDDELEFRVLADRTDADKEYMKQFNLSD